MGHLSRGVQIYHVEFKFITWSSILSRGVQIFLKGQIKKRDVAVSDKFHLSNDELFGLFLIRCF